MRHIDLFSGIGGFAYALDQVYENIQHIFVEIDPFAQAVLRKHWPEAEIIGDIRSFTADTGGVGLLHGKPEKLATELPHQAQRESSADIYPPFILTGGFPCQPFSQAGRRKGTSDDRFLWPEMLRVIRLTTPEWVIAENVRGILTIEQGMVFEQVCLDLEDSGYEVQAFVIPAVAVNAPHRRDRVWFVANRKPERDYKGPQKRQEQAKGREEYSWNDNWLEVATRLCRVDDGLPRRMDRNPRLKALGNAIVPQVAMQIIRSLQ